MLRCPACQTPFERERDGGEPRVGAVYRCHVCRLELELDPASKQLVLAPLGPFEPPPKNRMLG